MSRDESVDTGAPADSELADSERPGSDFGPADAEAIELRLADQRAQLARAREIVRLHRAGLTDVAIAHQMAVGSEQVHRALHVSHPRDAGLPVSRSRRDRPAASVAAVAPAPATHAAPIVAPERFVSAASSWAEFHAAAAAYIVLTGRRFPLGTDRVGSRRGGAELLRWLQQQYRDRLDGTLSADHESLMKDLGYFASEPTRRGLV
jgi:hypothetical protein